METTHVEDIFDALKQYATEHQLDYPKIEAVLTAVADEEHIALKLYDGPRITSSETVRTILDVAGVEYHNALEADARIVPIGKGVTGLFGTNNSGKTTFFRVLRWLIGGDKAVGRGMDERMIRIGEEEMSGRLTLDGENRFIARSIARRMVTRGKDKGQTKVDRTMLVKLNGHEEDKLSKANLEVETWLGGDVAFVLSIAFLEQGQLTRMLDADPSVRKEAFYKLVGVNAAEETAKKLRAVAKRLADAREIDLTNRAAYQKQLDDLAVKVKAIPPMEKLEAERIRLAPVATAADATTAQKRGELQKRIAAIDAEDVMKRSVSATPIDVAGYQAAAVTAREAATKAHTDAELLRQKYREVHALPDVCPICATLERRCDIDPAWKVAELEKIRQKGKDTAKAEADLTTLALQAEKNAREAADFEALRRTRIEQQTKLRAERALLVQQLEALPAGATSDASAVEMYAWTLQKIDELKALLANVDGLAGKLAAITKDAGALKIDLTGEQERVALDHAIRAFAKDGMPLSIARSHLAKVNRIAESMMDGDRFRFTFGNDLEIIVQDTHLGGHEIDPQLTCGSGRERGALILAAAMSRYQQELAGIRSQLFCIDELPFQDDANAMAFADTVKRLTKWFDRVVLAASDWHLYEGKFDHEVWMSQPLDEAAKSQTARAAEPTVKTYDDQVNAAAEKAVGHGEPEIANAEVTGVFTEPPTPAMVPPLSKIDEPAKDAVERMVDNDALQQRMQDLKNRLEKSSDPGF